MIALVAMFPVYLVAELNQKTGSIPVNSAPSENKERFVESNTKPALIPGYRGLSSFVIKLNAYDLNH